MEATPTVIIRAIEFVGNKKYTDKVLQQRIGIELGERMTRFWPRAAGGRSSTSTIPWGTPSWRWPWTRTWPGRVAWSTRSPKARG